MNKIDSFRGKYDFLSNFYNSPITYEDITYPTVEHFFQAMKTLDRDKRLSIALAATPGAAKRMGRKVTLRPNWEAIKDSIMKIGLELKFSDRELREKLEATKGYYLEEGNDWGDRYWGVYRGEGENHLGRLLMEVRDGK